MYEYQYDPTVTGLNRTAMHMTAQWVRTLQNGTNPYGNVDGQTVHPIPSKACTGRSGAQGKTFVGYIDLERGELHFDCAEAPDFHLTVDLSLVEHFASGPGGPNAEAAEASFEATRG